MSFTMSDVGKPLSDGDIVEMEKKLAVSLPEDYKTFLKQYNGGRPDPKFFPIFGFKNNTVGQVQDFFGIDDPFESCRLDWNFQTFFGRIPDNLFPIACEDGGSLICLSISGSDKGAIYYWDYYGETQPPSYDNIYQIAGTFQGFLDNIHFYDPLAEEDANPTIVRRDLPH
jgi:hypothetical protein